MHIQMKSRLAFEEFIWGPRCVVKNQCEGGSYLPEDVVEDHSVGAHL